jgi:protein-disulfide isomerase
MRAWLARLFSVAAIALLAAASLTAPLTAQAADEAEIEAVVRKLLTEKPDIVIDAIRAYQAREEAEKESRQREQVTSQKDALQGNPGDPVIGNPNGSITVVEFFDYRCGYCKRSLDTVLSLVDRNSDVRVVFKEFPILGEESTIAARASLALQKVAPQHYRAFHEKVMTHRGAMNKDALLKLAQEVGSDAAAVETAMQDPSIDETIRANYELAEALGIRGTPAFVVGEKVIPGAVGLSTLEELVAKERG